MITLITADPTHSLQQVKVCLSVCAYREHEGVRQQRVFPSQDALVGCRSRSTSGGSSDCRRYVRLLCDITGLPAWWSL